MTIDAAPPAAWPDAVVAARVGTAARAVGAPAATHPLAPGAANHVLALGDDLVLRIARTPAGARDLATEAVVLPHVVAAGVRTPALVWFDAGDDDVPAALVVRRAPGSDLAGADLAGPDAARLDGVLRETGRQLARVHTLGHELGHGAFAVPDDPWSPAAPLVRSLVTDGLLDDDGAAWLQGVLSGLEAAAGAPEPTLVHGDVAPQNLLADGAPPALTALLDWGDASWADPATDLAKLPLPALPAVVAGYREMTGDDAPWEARALRLHLAWALGRLRAPHPVTGGEQRHWTARPFSRLVGVLRFLADPPAGWPSLVPAPPAGRAPLR
ncbi:aminoglycoside phosphotransferase [Beutenbergia cavernae DSM 12333]|uniref:Aminoglycoside phosphotransferase n=1 Tax=Beutenbergia cavernae (strain ATCC BAA-8 / DSM 12333 / CCUG 43141 / JCM 11478 / NBRC 16432 / NCIMB 13614 / HKI 0122) TaxID=471853 RepID=C5BXH0_BEUC1|nr:aminoglycoside phosphotransferase family protein [Beutenbergia cavernae]ACQ80853.1 aminoglycoside phosphotransferase [Beutenbergia cavernae DSM 12333]